MPNYVDLVIGVVGVLSQNRNARIKAIRFQKLEPSGSMYPQLAFKGSTGVRL